jgi:hypothetical protein
MTTVDPTPDGDPISAAINDTDVTHDPLEGLVGKTKSDPSAAFMPEVLERLAQLKRHDRAGFEALRTQLKKAGCRVTSLDEALVEESGEARGRGPSTPISSSNSRKPPSYSTPRTVQASPILRSTVIGRLGRFAARDFVAGSHDSITKVLVVRRVQRRCNRH